MELLLSSTLKILKGVYKLADLSKIKLNGTEYNLKDAGARNLIPTTINDLTDKNFGIAWLDNSKTNRIIYCSNVSFSYTGESNKSSPFLFMIKSGTATTGTASIQGTGNYSFYNINTNSLYSGYEATGFYIIPNTEVLSYGVIYCGYLHDGRIRLFPLATEYKVNSLIASAIGNINALKISIVQSLPTTEIDTHTIYFVAKTGSTADVYDEYMYINNSWEKIGSTDINLNNYLQTDDIADWAKAATKPTYTATEVNALPSNTSYVSSFNGESGVITYTPPVTSVNGQTGAVTITDSDNKVSQSLSSSNLNLPILFRNNTDSTSVTTEAVRFVDSVTIQPSSGNLTATKFNNYTLAAACAKDVDSSITTGSTSTKLPTSAAVAAYVDAAIPTNISTFTNDAGYLTSYTETDPTVPSWAKASTKPTYTASEVGAATSSHTHGNITNTGDITTNVAIASGDRLVINDESASNINNSSITFGSSTAQYLANNGTWQNIPTTLPASDVSSWAKASTKPTYTASEVGAATSTHTHGNITNTGDITATATIASGDRLIINDESASKVINSSITFGSSTKQYLANNGTWQNAYDDTALAARVTALEQLEWATYYSGRSNPSNSQGANGDIYLQY